MSGSSTTTTDIASRLWSIEPPQALSFAGSEWEGVVVFAHGSGDTHQISHFAAIVLECLTERPRTQNELLTEVEALFANGERTDLPSLLEQSLRELQRIGLVRHRSS